MDQSNNFQVDIQEIDYKPQEKEVKYLEIFLGSIKYG